MKSITFRVESNKSKTKHWYTLVAGNGDTVMTSKTSYAEKPNAKRAAKRLIKALGKADLVLEYTDAAGRVVRDATIGEPSSESTGLSIEPVPTPSTRVAESRLV